MLKDLISIPFYALDKLCDKRLRYDALTHDCSGTN